MRTCRRRKDATACAPRPTHHPEGTLSDCTGRSRLTSREKSLADDILICAADLAWDRSRRAPFPHPRLSSRRTATLARSRGSPPRVRPPFATMATSRVFPAWSLARASPTADASSSSGRRNLRRPASFAPSSPASRRAVVASVSESNGDARADDPSPSDAPSARAKSDAELVDARIRAERMAVRLKLQSAAGKSPSPPSSPQSPQSPQSPPPRPPRRRHRSRARGVPRRRSLEPDDRRRARGGSNPTEQVQHEPLRLRRQRRKRGPRRRSTHGRDRPRRGRRRERHRGSRRSRARTRQTGAAGTPNRRRRRRRQTRRPRRASRVASNG